MVNIQDTNTPLSTSTNIMRIRARIKEIKIVLAEKTSDLELWRTYADSYDLLSSLQPASEQSNELPDAMDSSMEKFNEGNKQYQLGNFDEAEDYLVESISLFNRNLLAHMTIGNLFFLKGEYEKATKAFKDALSFSSGGARSEVLTNLGMNMIKQGHFVDAERCFLEAVELNRVNAFACNNLGLLNETKGNFDAAIGWYKKAVEAKPDDDELWYNLGNILGKIGDKECRLFCYIKAEERGFSELKEIINDLVAQRIIPKDPFL